MFVGKFNIFGGGNGKKAKKLDEVTIAVTDVDTKIVTTDTKKILIVKKGV